MAGTLRFMGCLPCELQAKYKAAQMEMPTPSDAKWSGPIGIEGKSTGDGRSIDLNALRWDTLPVPLRWVEKDTGEHLGAVVVGRITKIERGDDGRIIGYGDFDTGSEAGLEAMRQVKEGLTPGISMDLDDMVAEMDDKTGEMSIKDARIRAATIVAIPAFEGARIQVESPEAFTAAGGFGGDSETLYDLSAVDIEAFKNWVEKAGGLPEYIHRITKHLREKGMDESRAIATSVNVVKRACATGDLNFPGIQHENAGSQAEACAAVAEWERKKANHSADIDGFAEAAPGNIDAPSSSDIGADDYNEQFIVPEEPDDSLQPLLDALDCDGLPPGAKGYKGPCGHENAKPDVAPLTQKPAELTASADDEFGGLMPFFNPQQHPRAGKGTPTGGKFIPANHNTVNPQHMKQLDANMNALNNSVITAKQKNLDALVQKFNQETNDPNKRQDAKNCVLAITDLQKSLSQLGQLSAWNAQSGNMSGAQSKAQIQQYAALQGQLSALRTEIYQQAKIPLPAAPVSTGPAMPNIPKAPVPPPAASSAVQAWRDYSEATREKQAQKGVAMPDGSYPIANCSDLENAVRAIGRASDPDKVKAHIRTRAAQLKCPDVSLPFDSDIVTFSVEAAVDVPEDAVCLHPDCQEAPTFSVSSSDGAIDGLFCEKHAAEHEAQPLSMVAGAALLPRREWFNDPQLTEPTGLTVTKDGRVFGHLALWGTCHIANPQGAHQCTQPPSSRSQYAYFHTGVTETDGGDVTTGKITMNTLHAGPRLSANSTQAHYENTGNVAADVRAGEDRFGIWVAGAVRDGVDLRAMKAAPISGDWRTIAGSLELVAALSVNVPGFPVPRPKALVASGEVLSLVASGIVPQVEDEELEMVLSDDVVARLREKFKVLDQRDAKKDRVLALATQMKREKVARLAGDLAPKARAAKAAALRARIGFASFDPDKHWRVPKGAPKGGEFIDMPWVKFATFDKDIQHIEKSSGDVRQLMIAHRHLANAEAANKVKDYAMVRSEVKLATNAISSIASDGRSPLSRQAGQLENDLQFFNIHFMPGESTDIGAHDRLSVGDIAKKWANAEIPKKWLQGVLGQKDSSALQNLNMQRTDFTEDRKQKVHLPYLLASLKGVTPESVRKMTFMGGGPASGKSTIIKDREAHGDPIDVNRVTVNSDIAKTGGASEHRPDIVGLQHDFEAQIKAGNLKGAAGYVHEESSLMAQKLQSAAIEAGLSVLNDGVGDSEVGNVLKRIKDARDAGYHVEGIYASTDTESALVRAIIRGYQEKRYVDPWVVYTGHSNVSNIFDELAKNKDGFDELQLFNTDEKPPRLIASSERGVLKIADQGEYDKFLAKGHQTYRDALTAALAQAESRASMSQDQLGQLYPWLDASELPELQQNLNHAVSDLKATISDLPPAKV